MDELSPIPVRLGTLEFDLHTAQPHTHAVLIDRFQGFLRPDRTPRRKRLHVIQTDRLHPAEDPDAALHIAEPSFALNYIPGGESSVTSVIDREGRFVEDPLLTGLLHYVSLACIDHGALLVHAGAVVVGDRAVVFPGRSGAGKSTLAGMFPPEEVLNDEFVIVETEPARCASTPFYGTSMPDRRGRWALLPVVSFLQLSHGSPARLTDLVDPVSATGELMVSVVVPESAQQWQLTAFDLGVSLTPCRWSNLRFPLNPRQTLQTVQGIV